MRLKGLAVVSLALLSFAAATDVFARDLTFAVNNIYIGTFGLEPDGRIHVVDLPNLHPELPLLVTAAY